MAYRRLPNYRIPADWTEEDGYITVLFCLPNSRDWRGLITAHIESLTYGRLWDEQTGSIIDVQSVGREIFNSMAMCDLETQLTRIADSLESLDSKTAKYLTLQELLDDLAETIGIAHPMYILIKAIADMLPNLKFTVDVTSWLMSVLELISWRLPVLGFLATSTTALVAMAIAQVGSAFWAQAQGLLAIWNRVDSVLGSVKNFFFGGYDLWTDLFGPLFASVIPDSQGGTGGLDPDADPSKRIAVAVSVQQLVNLCCSSVPNLPIVASSDITAPEFDQFDGVSYGFPPTNPGGIVFGPGQTTDAQRCQVANYLWLSVQQFLYFFRSKLPEAVPAVGVGIGLIVGVLALMTVPIVIPTVALLAMALIAAGLTNVAALRQMMDNIVDVLESRQDDIVCALYNADSVADGRAAVRTIFADELSEIEVKFVMLLFNNTALSNLFYKSQEWDVSTQPTDCSECGQSCDIVLTHGTELGATRRASVQVVAGANNHTVRWNLIECDHQLFTINDFDWTGPEANTVEVKWNTPDGQVQNQWLHLQTLPQTYEVHGNSIFWITSSGAPSTGQHSFEVAVTAVNL